MNRNGYESEVLDGEIQQFNIEQKAKNEVNASISKVMHSNTSIIREIMEQPKHQVWIQLRDEILRRKPDVLGITCYSSSMNAVKYICNLVKEDSDIPIIIGGPHVSALPEASLRFSNADYAIFGEGENTLLELIKRIEEKKATLVDGLCCRQDSQVIFGGKRGLIEEIDTLPIPDRQLVDLKNYKSHTHVIITSRGCPYDCGYCASKVTWTRKVRFRSVDSVIEEIKLLKEKFGAKFIRIVDDIFTLRKKRVLRICNQIEELGLDTIRFSGGARVETLDEEIVAGLKRANFETITLGIESASPKVLELMDKRMSLKKATNAIKLLNDAGIRSHAFFMIGYPKENLGDVQKSKDFIANVRPREVEVNMVTPYPGTKLWDEVFGTIGPYEIRNWYQWFHQGIATHQVSFDLNAEYEEFLKFVTNYQKSNTL